MRFQNLIAIACIIDFKKVIHQKIVFSLKNRSAISIFSTYVFML